MNEKEFNRAILGKPPYGVREKRYEELSEEELRNALEALKEIAEYTSEHEVDKSTPFCDMRLYAEGKNHAKHKVNEILIKYCIV